MTYRELQELKMNVYKDYIKQRYGEKELNKLEDGIKDKVKKKILAIKDKNKFDDALIRLNDSITN